MTFAKGLYKYFANKYHRKCKTKLSSMQDKEEGILLFPEVERDKDGSLWAVWKLSRLKELSGDWKNNENT